MPDTRFDDCFVAVGPEVEPAVLCPDGRVVVLQGNDLGPPAVMVGWPPAKV